MSNVWDLDAMRSALESEYAPMQLNAGGETFVLQSLMRVPKKVRTEVVEKMKALETEDEDSLSEDDATDVLRAVIVAVTQDKRGDKLVKLIGDDLLLLQKVVGDWMEATQPGEATDSPS